MNIEQFKVQIQEKLKKIESFDFSKFYLDMPQVVLWNDVTASESKKMVDDTVSTLVKLNENLSLLDTLGFSSVQNIDTHLTNFLAQSEQLNNLQDAQVTSQHHDPLNQLNGLNSALRNTGLYNQLNLIPNLTEVEKKLKKAERLSDQVISKEDDLKNALSTLKEYLDTKTDVRVKAVKEYSVTFSQRADENKIHRNTPFFSWRFSGNWWWLLGSLVFGALVFIVAWFLLLDADLTPGSALARVFLLVIPGYFTVFCSQQFIHHKKMYETYSFKETANNTMNKLQEGVADEKVKERILDKGLDVIFNEPSTRQEKAPQSQQLVGDLMNMLREQMKQNAN